MSSASLDLVRSLFAAWERGDFSSAEWAHPEIEWVIADGFEPDVKSGLAGLKDAWREFASLWADYSIEVEEYREVDAGRVLVLYKRTGHGKTSGIELGNLRSEGVSVFHVQEGKVTRLVSYSVPESAFADLGLAPDTST